MIAQMLSGSSTLTDDLKYPRKQLRSCSGHVRVTFTKTLASQYSKSRVSVGQPSPICVAKILSWWRTEVGQFQ